MLITVPKYCCITCVCNECTSFFFFFNVAILANSGSDEESSTEVSNFQILQSIDPLQQSSVWGLDVYVEALNILYR